MPDPKKFIIDSIDRDALILRWVKPALLPMTDWMYASDDVVYLPVSLECAQQYRVGDFYEIGLVPSKL